MNKKFKILFVFLSLFLLVGCGNKENKNTNNTTDDKPSEKIEEKEKVTKCTLNSNQEKAGYKLESIYEVYSSNGIATKVITKETVTSENSQILDYFEKQLKETYKASNDAYGGYTYSVKKESNSVTSNVEINYEEMNMEKFVEENSDMEPYVNDDGKITEKGIISIYKTLGAVCE